MCIFAELLKQNVFIVQKLLQLSANVLFSKQNKNEGHSRKNGGQICSTVARRLTPMT